MSKRFVVKVVGESGQGVNSIGESIAKTLKNTGLYIFGYREYPSLIKGGYASYQIDIADQVINSSLSQCNLLMCLSRVSFRKYLRSLGENGIAIHNVFKLELSDSENQFVQENKITVKYVPATDLALSLNGKRVMANTVMLGIVWQILNLDLQKLQQTIKVAFKNKPEVIKVNLACLQLGFKYDLKNVVKAELSLPKRDSYQDDLLMTGNQAIALGAIAGGVRVFYAYPMTPSSSILTYLASVYHSTGMIVKQIEDEISVANMAVGSMHAGARTLIATSGGGFDLMTETVSLTGITETPFVCVIAQRPGPGTGLPTWSASSDLNIAVYAGHGEYTRCVLAAHDVSSCYTLTQQAFNIAEKYQIPVVILTEKQIAESIFQVDSMPEDITIERGLITGDRLTKLQSSDRFKLTESGVSPRWIPGSCKAVYDANSDEHLGDGTITEDAKPAKATYDKRLRKKQSLLNELPEPDVFGDDDPSISFVGWGSVKNAVVDAINIINQTGKIKVAYLHYEYIYPVKTERFKKFVNDAKKLVLIENNATGQLGNLLVTELKVTFDDKLLKMNGRPFFVDEILRYVEREVKS